MYQLTVTSRKQLERATLRAQAQKPRIEEVVFGIYKVWSTDPAKPNTFYLVGIEPAQDGGYEVCCSCPTQKYFCKHTASCLPHYQMREKEYKAEETRMAQAQEMTDQEWGEIELEAENEAMLEAVEEMLRQDRLDVFGY